jgi:hypothetical protein
MSRTVSVMATLTEQCSQCGLWFEFLHPGADGRFLCRTCFTLEARNRARRDPQHGRGEPPGSVGPERSRRPVAPSVIR